MKITLVFEDWMKKGTAESVYSTEKGASDLTMGCFHAGTTFYGRITFHGDEEELKRFLEEGFEPVFRLVEVEDE